MPVDHLIELLRGAQHAALATADDHGRPHVVPIVFVWNDGHIYSAVDHKPKRSRDLKRLRNIAANPRVSLLVDEYTDDWTRLWWVRADGRARLHDDGARFEEAVRMLAEKYEQYDGQPPAGPVIDITVTDLRGWAATSGGPVDSADRP